MNILVTGGMGYIGSHTVVELLNDEEKRRALGAEDAAAPTGQAPA